MNTQSTLVGILRAARELPSEWESAFTAVDRGAFVPSQIWVDDHHGIPQPIDRDTDPDRWADAVYADLPIVTQFDDGATRWPTSGDLVTSSASQPGVVLDMLSALEVQQGHRVLEVGTGTGYNAALLCERLGEDNVTTIEVDPDLAEQARDRLAAAGYKPTVACGDGTEGNPAGAPYNRVISTAAVGHGRVPYAWIEQTSPGGQILLPWATAFRNGVLVRLTVGADGTASGPVVGPAQFMRIRDHRADAPYGQAHRLAVKLYESPATTTRLTSVPPLEVASGDGAFAAGLRMPDVQSGVFWEPDGGYEVLLYHVPTESVASLIVAAADVDAGSWAVRQLGPRRLWDEAESAHARWVADRRPGLARHGIGVERGRQWVWLDEPSKAIASY